MSKKLPVFDHKAMISDPDRWPCWPFLPVKKRGNPPSISGKTLGLLCYTEEFVERKKVVVYHVYLFDVIDLTACPTTEYASIDDLVAAGWEVD